MKLVFRILVLVFNLAILAFVIVARVDDATLITTPISAPETVAAAYDAAAAVPAEISVSTEATPSPQPTPVTTPEPTPEPKDYVFSFVGDCTLWSNANYANHPAGYAGVMGDDYAYPFSNTAEYFKNDECTFANLECLLSDTQMTVDYTAATFAFIAPTEYANIIIEGGVDFVTTANNHLMDCYEKGRDRTYETLDKYGIQYGQENQSQLITTPDGIKVGVYTAGINMRPDWKQDEVLADIVEMHAQGADIVVCMFHWGEELYYEPRQYQNDLAHACIDAGADIVYGSHSHCLQPVEEYNGGIIMYSMGNWTFGGSTMPKDPDTAIIQVTLKKNDDGTFGYGSYKEIPCCVSSNIEAAASNAQNYNDYCPTPYEENTNEYYRVLSKLDGSFEPTSQGADYSAWYASRAS